ncbi:MAG: PAS domain S-box protein, partial [Verrucomicrobia bacterium]|nr:PAS domain S-box protein [Verrucomicrobiota bacterium]
MKFLHLENHPRDTALVRSLLRAAWPGCTITVIVDRSEYVIELGREGYDLILSECAPGGFPGFAALELARTQRPDTPFVFFTATRGEDRALDAVHLGAADYVVKDQPDRLVPAVERALAAGARLSERRQAEAAQRRIAELFDLSPDLVATVAPGGRILELNRAGRRLLRLPEGSNLSDLNARQLHPPDIAEFIFSVAIPEAVRSQTWSGETILLARDGTPVPVAQVLVAHRLPDGTVSHLSTTMRDLTAQRRDEAALRAQHERFQLVAHATNDSIWDWNLLTDEIWWSESYETQFGHPRTALESSLAAWKRHIHPDDLARVELSLGETLAGGQPAWRQEYRYARANGTYAEVLDRGRILYDPAGRPCRMIASMLDITERKLAEHRVRELIELLDRAPDAILVTDLGGRVTFWNRGAERLSGFGAHEARGRNVEDLFGPEARPKLSAAGLALESRDEWRGEVHLLNREARPIIAEFSASVVRDDRGQPRARLTIVSDITERKKLEDRFLRAQRLESVGMLAAGIAHDLNNVLSPILMGAPILRDHITDAGDLQLLAMFEKSAERGAGLVRQILSFAHGVGGEPRQIQVKHLLRDLGTVIAETFPKNIKFETHLAPNLWLVTANPTQIHQVLLNLCVNARDSMPNGGVLSLRAENRLLDDTAA